MTEYGSNLPQLTGKIFLTDGGLETTLIFHEGIDLPHFAAFDLLREQATRNVLKAYYTRYAAIARRDGAGFILESPTWRASADWGEKLGYSREALAAVNRDAIELLEEVREEYQTNASPMVIAGCIGPRGDGYDPGQIMTAGEAEAYHSEQIRTFAQAGAEMISAITMTNVPEAVGIARAAKAAGIPVVISFTVETDGHLPTGQSLGEAIETVDAETGAAPTYYMINCAHPTHFEAELAKAGAWLERLRGLRANASKCSHAELDEAEELDEGDPEELGDHYHDLLHRHAHINVIGGCCGTDHRHIERISAACKVVA